MKITRWRAIDDKFPKGMCPLGYKSISKSNFVAFPVRDRSPASIGRAQVVRELDDKVLAAIKRNWQAIFYSDDERYPYLSFDESRASGKLRFKSHKCALDQHCDELILFFKQCTLLDTRSRPLQSCLKCGASFT
jgi:hypothetical protein